MLFRALSSSGRGEKFSARCALEPLSLRERGWGEGEPRKAPEPHFDPKSSHQAFLEGEGKNVQCAVL